MRTTLSIDDHLLAAAKRRSRQRGQTVGQVVEDALRRELAEPDRRPSPPIPIHRGGGGVMAGVDATSNRALREALDGDADVQELR